MLKSVLSLLSLAAFIYLALTNVVAAQERISGEALARLPLYFESNTLPSENQPASAVRFRSRTSNGDLQLEDAAIDLVSNGESVLRMRWNGKEKAKPFAENELETKVNYLIGSDPKQWRTNISTFGRVRYPDAFPGTDLVFYGNARQLEYDLVLRSGAEIDRVSFDFEGAEKIEVCATGDLLIQTVHGPVIQRKPLVFQEREGQRTPLEAGYVLLTRNRVGFEVQDWDGKTALTIDPVVDYSLLFGGPSHAELVSAIAADSAGSAYVIGRTTASDLPVSGSPVQSQLKGLQNAFIAKFNSAGTGLVYCTYLGGALYTNAKSIAVDASANVFITGDTSSPDFPVTPGAFQTVRIAQISVFVSKLNPAGSGLVYSTYIGSNQGTDSGTSIAVDAAGAAYITGTSFSFDYPHTSGAFDATNGVPTGSLTFVTKLAADGGHLVYSAHLAGRVGATPPYITLDSAGNAYVAGYALQDFPVTPGAIQPQAARAFQDGDAFVCELNASGSALVFSTFLGGNWEDWATGIARDSQGNIYITGITRSADFPVTPGAYMAANQRLLKSFLTKLNPSGTNILFSTLFGDPIGFTPPLSNGIAVDSDDNVFITGYAGSDYLTPQSPFPILAPVQALPTARDDYRTGFLAKFSSAGALLSSTYLSGQGVAVAAGAAGSAYVAGVADDTRAASTPDSATAGLNHGAFFVEKINTASTCTISIAPLSASVPATASSTVVNVTASSASCNWIATSDQPWITPTTGKGSGPAVIQVAATGTGRTARVSIGGLIFTVIQPSDCGTSLSTTTQSVGAQGSGFDVQVNGPPGCLAAGISNADWLTVVPLHDNVIGYYVVPNLGPPRTGTLTLSGLTLTVNQSGGLACAESLDTTSAYLSSEAQAQYALISTSYQGCTWTTVSNAPWISIPSSASSTVALGQGSNLWYYSVTQNTGPTRIGTITIAGQTFTVIQEGPPALDPLNQGFESPSLFPWTAFGSTIVKVTNARSSSSSTRSLEESGGAGGVYQDVTGLTPGQFYHVSARVALLGINASATLWVHDGRGANAVLDTAFVANTGAYISFNLSVDFQADFTGALRIHLLYPGTSSAFPAYWDDVHVSAGWQGGLKPHWTPFGAIVCTCDGVASNSGPSLSAGSGGIYQDIGGLMPGELYHIRVRAHSVDSAFVNFPNAPPPLGDALLYVHDTTGANVAVDGPRTAGRGFEEFAVNFIATSSGKVRIHLLSSSAYFPIQFDDLRLTQAWSGDFESGHLAPWTSFGSGTVAVDNATANNSVFSLSESGAAGGAYQDITGLVPGQLYNVSARAHSANGTSSQALLWLHDTTGAAVISDGPRTPSSASWELFNTYFPADNIGQMRIHLLDLGGSGAVAWDDVTVRQGLQEGFETGTVAPWLLGGGVTAAVSTNVTNTGAFSLAESGGNGLVYRDFTGLKPGQYYRVTVQVRSAGGPVGQAMLYLHDGTGANTVVDGPRTASSTGWDQFAVNFLATATGTVRIHLVYAGGPGTVYFDDLQMLRAWGSGFETSTLAPWNPLGGATLGVTSGQAYTGRFSLTESGTSGGAYIDVPNAVAGQLYRITARSRSAAGSSAQGALYVHDTTGANVAVDGFRTPSSDSWDEFGVNFTATASGSIRIHLLTSGSGTLNWDEVLILPVAH